MTEREKAIRRFLRAAKQRLATSEFLIENKLEQYPLDAVYLGGYAVECSLKAMILRWTPMNRSQPVYDEITRGRKGHSLESLAESLKRQKCILPVEILQCLRAVNWWTTDLRYETRNVRYRDARAFWEAATEILTWAESN